MPAPSSRGFTLVECIVALALAGFAILVGAALLTSQARIAERVEARQVLLRTAEAVVESVRAGAVPMRTGPVLLDLGGETEIITDIRSSLDVRPTARSGLYLVTARTGCSLRDQEVEVRLETMVYQP